MIYKQESYNILGKCYDVHHNLGLGFLEIVYKEALMHEFFNQKIPYAREVPFDVRYRDIILKRRFYADFVAYDKIILEIKSGECLSSFHIAQTINYLKVSGLRLGFVVNFNAEKLLFKRLIV